MYDCGDLSGVGMPSQVMCKKNEAGRYWDDFVEWNPNSKKNRERVLNQVKSMVDTQNYDILGNNTKIEECSLKCIEQANKKGFPGCCEYRVVSGECAWLGEEAYLSPKVRNIDMNTRKPKDSKNTKAVLCSKGNLA